MRAEDVRHAIAGVPLWYHTIDVAPTVTTPGWFDLRSVMDRLPWPDLHGKRCLDIGTWDGHLAFEMERRGAAEVLAVDIDDHTKWDWPTDARVAGPQRMAALAGATKGTGFTVAKAALGSAVERRWVSVYDLHPDEVGTFDFVVMGALLLHLRDPVRALEAVRSVCRGQLLSWEQIDPALSIAHRKRPVASLKGVGTEVQWWVPNPAAHVQMLRSARFAVERTTKAFAGPFGPAHPSRQSRPKGKARRDLWLVRAVCGGVGVPTHAVLACRMD